MSVLCDIALDAIDGVLTENKPRVPNLDDVAPALRAPGASFVTLERGTQLLGCVGTLEARQPLALDVAEHAVAAGFHDPRVPAITRADFSLMSVKVSVLSRSSTLPVHSYDELRSCVRPGVDGITIEVGRARATLLPSVWSKVADVDEFLDALWLKCGLRPRSWPDTLHVSRYTTVEECDPGPR